MNNKEKVQEFNKLIKDMGLKSYADPTSTPGRFSMTSLFQFEYAPQYYRMTIYPNGICVVTQYLDPDSEPNQMVTYDSAEQLKKVCQLMGKAIPVEKCNCIGLPRGDGKEVEMEKIGNPVKDLPPTAWRGPHRLEPPVWHDMTQPPVTYETGDHITKSDTNIEVIPNASDLPYCDTI